MNADERGQIACVQSAISSLPDQGNRLFIHNCSEKYTEIRTRFVGNFSPIQSPANRLAAPDGRLRSDSHLITRYSMNGEVCFSIGHFLNLERICASSPEVSRQLPEPRDPAKAAIRQYLRVQSPVRAHCRNRAPAVRSMTELTCSERRAALVSQSSLDFRIQSTSWCALAVFSARAASREFLQRFHILREMRR
jgi:hypothetical protein